MINIDHNKPSWQKFLNKANPFCVLEGFGHKGLLGKRYLLVHYVSFVITIVLLITAAQPLSSGQDSSRLSAAEARKIIVEGNRQWGKARVDLDIEAFEKMLAPDFYVQLPGRKLTRQQFIKMISAQMPGAKLTRFDATVLTVQRAKDGWVAIIHEKLEMDSPNGKVYSLWITRDGWRKVGDQWVITFSEAIGSETWLGGEKPPFQDW
jgi:hypothetical protein